MGKENGETKALCIMEYEGHTAAAERRAVCRTKKDTGDLIKLSAYEAAKKFQIFLHRGVFSRE